MTSIEKILHPSEILAASKRLKEVVRKTPAELNAALSEQFEAEIY